VARRRRFFLHASFAEQVRANRKTGIARCQCVRFNLDSGLLNYDKAKNCNLVHRVTSHDFSMCMKCLWRKTLMSLPGIDPDPQVFGNRDKLLSNRPVFTGAYQRFHRGTRFSLRSIPDSMQVSEME